LANGNILITDRYNYRVIEVDRDRQIIWQYGTTSNHRVIEVDRDRQIIWQYGTSGAHGLGDNQLYHPTSATPLANGNILITDRYNYRVIEVDRDRQIIWQYGTTRAGAQLHWPTEMC
jgi:hypothetical protein